MRNQFSSSSSSFSSSSTSNTFFKLSNLILFFIILLFLTYFITLFHFNSFILSNQSNGIMNYNSNGTNNNNNYNNNKLRKNLNSNFNNEINESNESNEQIKQLSIVIKRLNSEINELNQQLQESKDKIDLLSLTSPSTPIPSSLSSSSSSSSLSSSSNLINNYHDNTSHTGIIVLGMHRSGTSIIGGLINKMGLNTGGPLIPPNFDNEKGFFERIDVVLQNDYIMKKQQVHYAYRTSSYDNLQGIKSILTEDNGFFNEGKRALKFLNNPLSYPWMLKDPRLCITLRTWLPFLNSIPAILFTYRNPFDVALSMHNRETEHFPISKGLKLWYVYNKRAIQQSSDLCRVITSHSRVMKNPIEELKKVYNEMRYKCNIENIHPLTTEQVNSFIDIKLQHGKTSEIDQICQNIALLKQSNDYDEEKKEKFYSEILPPSSKWDTKDSQHIKLYQSSVKLFCEMEDQEAFKLNYQFDETIID